MMSVVLQESLASEVEARTTEAPFKPKLDIEDGGQEPYKKGNGSKPYLSTSVQMLDVEKEQALVQNPELPSKVTVAPKNDSHQDNDRNCSCSCKCKCNNNTPDKGYFDLVHHNGAIFRIPLAQCKTWEGLKEAIKMTFGSNEKAKKEILEERFEIFALTLFNRDSRATFLKKQDVMACMGSHDRIVVQLASENDNSPLTVTGTKTDPEKEVPETKYVEGVKYRIDYFVRAEFFNLPPELLTTITYDHPVELTPSSLDSMAEQHVLEEIKVVTFNNQTKAPTRDQITKEGAKLDINDTIGARKLKICSPFLLNALRAVAKYSFNPPSGDGTDTFKDGIFPYPFQDLLNHMPELQDYKTKTSKSRANHSDEYNGKTDRHIDLLMEYLRNESHINLRFIEAAWEKKIPTTTFSSIFLLLKPGTDVYVQENGQLNAYVIDSVSGGVDYSVRDDLSWNSKTTKYSIYVWNLVYDGKIIKRRLKMVEILVFDGHREIRSLPLFPTKFQDKFDEGARRKRLVDRGIKYLQYSKGPAFLEYSGLGLRPGWKKYNRARVVVEHRSLPWHRPEFSKLREWGLSGSCGVRDCDICDKSKHTLGERTRIPQCECNNCGSANSGDEVYLKPTFSDYDNIDPEVVNELSDHQYMLCASHMFGFVLKDRVHDLLDMNGLNPPRLITNAIDYLVLRPESNKYTIKAIVQTYSDSTTQAELFSADFIKGKGEGQIFLLHGPPGTGKTLTAESVAEYTRRPLLSITAADLGHEPAVLEQNLLRFFKNATSWDAIVLLDEADIYLERRSSNDLRRNNVVSIFLRALDYFQGILFLTTNRVGHFDEAFMSRIHVSIGYDTLDDTARVQIWDALFRKLKDDHKHGGPEIRYDYDAKRYVQKHEDVKKLQWNGREIRNAFQTAVALAIYDSKTARERGVPLEDSIPEVTEAHLAQVVSMSAAFKKYIKATHEGYEDADLAYKLGNRHDRLNEEAAD